MENATAGGAGVQACGWLSSHRWVLFAACGLFLCFVPWGVDPHHDGLMLKSAMDVAAGRVVFRDSFNQYGLLTPLLQGAAVRFFGAEIIVLRLLTVLFYALSAMELDRLWCRFLSEPFRWLTFGLFLGLAPFYVWIMLSWSSVYALYFMLLGGTLMVRYLEGGGLRLLFGCGVAAGIAFGFRQPCGIVMVPAGILTLGLEVWTRRLKFREALYRFGIWSGGVLVFPAFLALYLTVFGAWRDYWRQCWVNTARFSQDAGGDRITDLLSCLFPADSVFLLFPLAALGCFGWMVWRLWRRRSGEWQLPFCAALLVGLASWHQYYPVPCLRHCYWGAIPMFGALAFVAEQWWCSRRGRNLRIAGLIVLLAWPAAAAGWRIGSAVLNFSRIDQRAVEAPGFSGLRVNASEGRLFQRFAADCRAVPERLRERPWLNLTRDALYCRFFPEQPNFHPMFVNWGYQVYPDYPGWAGNFVRSYQPVVITENPSPFPGYRTVCGFPYRDRKIYLSLPPL